MAYCTRADIERRFAASDIRKWADLEQTGADDAAVEAVITEAIAQATAEIDDRLRGGKYTVPFDPVPRTIMDLARCTAACILYAGKGAQDFSPEGFAMDRLAGVRADVDKRLRQIRAGVIELDATQTESHPQVIPVTLHRDETPSDVVLNEGL